MKINRDGVKKTSVIDFSDKSVFVKFGLLLDMVRDWYLGNYREISAKHLGLIGLGLIYIISPYDIVPEFLLGLGILDDLVLAGFILKKIDQTLEKYYNWRTGNGDIIDEDNSNEYQNDRGYST